LERQLALFEAEEKEGNSSPKTENLPRPMAKIRMENHPEIIGEIPFKSEAERLFQSTSNRMFIPSSKHRELKEISDRLVTVLKKFGDTPENLRKLVEMSEKILTVMKNLYSIQGIDFAVNRMNSENVWSLPVTKKTIRR
jgi:hypothetical protein